MLTLISMGTYNYGDELDSENAENLDRANSKRQFFDTMTFR